MEIELECGKIVKVGSRVVEKVGAEADAVSLSEEKDVNDTSSDSSDEESEKKQGLVPTESSNDEEESSSGES